MSLIEEYLKAMTCPICQKRYSSLPGKYRHIRTIHSKVAAEERIHMKCPICSEDEKISFKSYADIIAHLENVHSLNIRTSCFSFDNEEKFEIWRVFNGIRSDYIKTRVEKNELSQVVYFECIRNNYPEYVIQCCKFSRVGLETGDGTKLSGFCPAGIRAEITSTVVNVKFVETHVGHCTKIKSEHLPNNHQEMVAGVSGERFLEDDNLKNRVAHCEIAESINKMCDDDIAWMSRRLNVNKRKRNCDDDSLPKKMSKMEPSNSEGKPDSKFLKIDETSFNGKTENFAETSDSGGSSSISGETNSTVPL